MLLIEDKLYSGVKLELDVQAENLLSQLVLLIALVTVSKSPASLELFPLVNFEFVARALQLSNSLCFHKLDSVTT